MNSSMFSSNDFLEQAASLNLTDIHIKNDPISGMQAIIAIHSNKLGPALGGCRFMTYPNGLAALHDVMRLAQGMSYKAASVNLPLGGGKAVIIKPQHDFDRNAYLQHFGRFVNELQGRYITAVDSGTNVTDMDIVAQQTPYVASASTQGDPSLTTGKGVMRGIKAAVAHRFGQESIRGLHIVIQGLGHVGYFLARELHDLGARLTLADINSELMMRVAHELNAETAPVERIHQVPCDIFSPCALGGVLNDNSIAELQTAIIAGAANNQLMHAGIGEQLHQRGILYAPDYIINAGGLIYAAHHYHHWTSSIEEQLDSIYHSLIGIFERSMRENRATNAIADELARAKLA